MVTQVRLSWVITVSTTTTRILPRHQLVESLVRSPDKCRGTPRCEVSPIYTDTARSIIPGQCVVARSAARHNTRPNGNVSATSCHIRLPLVARFCTTVCTHAVQGVPSRHVSQQKKPGSPL
mmetsp:Transcript_1083/g.2310  ORF Transcript_1083/g.2310 Transcript_1083/m.2310 type:complete len:121 (+) Transcript_1083:76-438(+)